MRKILFLYFVVLTMISCSKSEFSSIISRKYDNGAFHFQEINSNEKITNKIDLWNKKINQINSQISTRSAIEDSLYLDMNNLTMASQDETEGDVIIAMSKNNTSRNYLCAGYYEIGDTIVNNLIIKTEILTDSTANITYYDFNSTPITGFQVNTHTGLASYNETHNTNNIQGSQQRKQMISGDATMGCVNDTYSNHGWLSAYILIQTAFIPQTAVAIVLACAIKNRASLITPLGGDRGIAIK